MKIYAPRYYTDFACIADKCTHSCCIGWEIDIDKNTEAKYRSLSGEYAKIISDSIEHTDTAHFRLSDGERCTHLSESGLCKIICEYGDGYLCDICREHPRYYNYTSEGIYAGVGMACEEACRLILSSDGFHELIRIGEETADEIPLPAPIPHRDEIFAVLSDKSLHHEEKLTKLYETFGAIPSTLSDEAWKELLFGLEYLDESNKELFSCYTSNIKTPSEHESTLCRALAYFVYRHAATAEDEGELRAALGFCFFAERLLASILKSGKENAFVAARIISEELEYSEDNTEAIKNEFLFA